MKIDNLPYSKTEPSKNIIEGPVSEVSKISGEDSGISGLGAEETEYSKGAPTLETKIIFILSGGSEREKDYFRPLKKNPQIRSIKIAFRSKKGQGLKPYELKSLSEEFIVTQKFITEENVSYNIENEDTLFIIQDVDEFGDEIKKYLNEVKEGDSVQWIISNPSFEIWLFYHHFSDPSILKDCESMSEHDRSNWLKEYLNTIVPGGIKPSQSFYTTTTAIDNSKKNYFEERGFPALFSTRMHDVAEMALKIMGKEYDAMIKRREQQISFYKGLSNNLKE